MRGLMVVVLLVLAVGGALAAPLEPLPPELAAKWLSALSARDGWNALGYDTEGWAPVSYDLPVSYPIWMTPAQQARHRLMWHPAGNNNGQPVYFRRQLWVSGRVTEAFFRVAADDQFRFYANGRLLGEEREPLVLRQFTLDGLAPGANVLAAEARDVMGQSRGLVVIGEVTQEWPFTAEEQAWRCSLSTGTGWTGADYDDTQWQPAVPDRAPAIEADHQRYECFTTPQDLDGFVNAYFRRTLDLDGVPVAAKVTILGDDSYQLYVNGQLVALERRMDYAWRPATVDITSALHHGRNVLAVQITNTWGPARLYCAPVVKMVF